MSAQASNQSPVVLQRQQSARQQHQKQPSTSSRHTHTSSRGGEYATGDPDAGRTSMTSGRSNHTRQTQEGAQASGAPSAAPAPGHNDPRAANMQRPKKSSITGVSGTWILGKTIGAGSMGKVKLAKKADGSETVAVKIVPRHLIQERGLDPATGQPYPPRHDDSKEVRTAREAAIATLLDHPYICGMRDVIKTNNHWYMLCEYVNGGQMLDYIISHGRLKEKQARKFARQIASALDYCHRNSIVHRDLKIENILISKTGDIKIIDFGLSNLFSPRSHLKTFCGSLYFAAPELLQAKQYVGPEVDVWSFGIVLYVLVCGKVPFDDQNMPALHAKIKRGQVDYPTWISNECRLLLSRMLVTDPRQRATLQEIMNHPWIMKGYNSPPENFLPHREPLALPLDPLVVKDMTGFEFGSSETIMNQLARVVESEDYQAAVNKAARDAPLNSPNPDKRKFSLDFYKRRQSTSSKDTLAAPSQEALNQYTQSDPINAYNPLVSIYYLVREKHERDRRAARQSTVSHTEADKAPRLATIQPPEAVHTGETKYEIQGEPTTGAARTRPRARTHGEDEITDTLQPPSAAAASPSPTAPQKTEEPPVRKDLSVGGMLRRLSTRRHGSSNPKAESKHMPTPSLSLQPPDQKPVAISAPRKSLSLRRPKEAVRAFPKMNSSQPGNSELLTPPTSADGTGSKNSKLGRSTSVSEADWRRKYNRNRPPGDASGTSGSDRISTLQEGAAESQFGGARAKSVGHGRKAPGRRTKEEDTVVHVPSNDDALDDGADATISSGSGEAPMPAANFVKPVFLKGLFSVSTTSTKPPVEIRKDIIRVLQQLGVSYKEIRGGFSCVHRPSIDLKSVMDTDPQAADPSGLAPAPSHRRKPSYAGSSSKRRSRSDNSPITSDASNESVSDGVLAGSLVLQFEIYIVKVPLLSLHGIQFKSVNKTNTWQYKSLASRILSELRL